MKIEIVEIALGDIVAGYVDSGEEGVVGYAGKLDIRPAYQREFIYEGLPRDNVIRSVLQNLPINVMHWVINGANYELLDGQQRTVSICRYVNNEFPVDNLRFENLPNDKQLQLLNYKVLVYMCEGTDSEKLKWFQTVNTPVAPLLKQELRNAVYTGTWLADAKRHFGKTECPAHKLGGDYLKGTSIRQEYLETALDWISEGDIVGYMSEHQHAPNASELWLYFSSVINWVKTYFPKYRKEMKGLPWGELYNAHKNDKLDAKRLETEITRLLMDDEIDRKAGVYRYLLTGEEKYLNIRAFSDKLKREAYEAQKGRCPMCPKTIKFDLEQMEADHITPWSEGGRTLAENCQLLCKRHNRAKGAK